MDKRWRGAELKINQLIKQMTMTCQLLCYVIETQYALDGQNPFAQEVDWLVGSKNGV